MRQGGEQVRGDREAGHCVLRDGEESIPGLDTDQAQNPGDSHHEVAVRTV